MQATARNYRPSWRGAAAVPRRVLAVTAAGLILTAGCRNKTVETGSGAGTPPAGITTAPAVAPTGTGARRGNPEPDAAAKAAAFKAARDRAEGR